MEIFVNKFFIRKFSENFLPVNFMKIFYQKFYETFLSVNTMGVAINHIITEDVYLCVSFRVFALKITPVCINIS